MKYELIGKNNLLNPIETILHNRGIEDIQSFLNISENATHDWRLLNNIELAAETLLNNLNSNIFIQIDEDNDGYFSSAILYNYLKKVHPDIKITWKTHERKMHGIVTDIIPDDTNIVIIPDAGSNQYEEHKLLKEKGMTVIILDHHQCDKESEYAIVVNNQLSESYPNKEFSACGIVYKFCKALDCLLGVNFADEYLDLVAIGNIADSMSTGELETRYYIKKGLSNIKNPLVKEIVKRNEYTLKGKVTIKDVSWTIAPMINSVARIGSMEERENMFKALTYHQGTIYNSRKKEDEPIVQAMARIISNVRGRQNRLRDKIQEQIIEKIEIKNLNQNKFMIVDGTDCVEPALSGLIAIKIAEKYKKPTLIFRYSDMDQILTGSARGYEKGNIQDLRSFLLDTGKFIFCEGHPQAHGFSIKPENIIEANKIINKKLRNVETGINIYYVDFVINSKQISVRFIKDISKYKAIWGKGVEEPFLCIKNLEVNSDELKLQGSNSNTIKFEHKKIEYIKFKSNENEFNGLTDSGERLVLNVIGKASMNEYEGKTTPQIIIDDIEVVETKAKQYVF